MIAIENLCHINAEAAGLARRRYRAGGVEPTSGVAPQVAAMASGVPFAITHAPGHTFITDIPDTAYHA